MVKMTPKSTGDDATAGKEYEVWPSGFRDWVHFIDDDGDKREWDIDRFNTVLGARDDNTQYIIILEAMLTDEQVYLAKSINNAL